MRRVNLQMQRNSDSASTRALHAKQTKKFTKGVDSMRSLDIEQLRAASSVVRSHPEIVVKVGQFSLR